MFKGHLSITLVVVAVLASQGYAAQHLHATDMPTSCVACTYASEVPAGHAGPATIVLVQGFVGLSESLLEITKPLFVRLTPHVRAPPFSSHM